MAEVLGRVTQSSDGPRGPDVQHRIRVAQEWVALGAAIEFELPRNVTCAACEGGGCDRCERSGAITLRGRDEPAESVRVTLPKWDDAEDPPSSGHRGMVLRIPEHGGLPEPDSGLPRGTLLLRIVVSDESDSGIVRVRRTEPPPEVVETSAPTHSNRKRRSLGIMLLAVAVVLWILFLIMLRLSGLA